MVPPVRRMGERHGAPHRLGVVVGNERPGRALGEWGFRWGWASMVGTVPGHASVQAERRRPCSWNIGVGGRAWAAGAFQATGRAEPQPRPDLGGIDDETLVEQPVSSALARLRSAVRRPAIEIADIRPAGPWLNDTRRCGTELAVVDGRGRGDAVSGAFDILLRTVFLRHGVTAEIASVVVVCTISELLVVIGATML